jgi:hypothetical protein
MTAESARTTSVRLLHTEKHWYLTIISWPFAGLLGRILAISIQVRLVAWIVMHPAFGQLNPLMRVHLNPLMHQSLFL